MLYEITYLSKVPITYGKCLECDQQAISSDPTAYAAMNSISREENRFYKLRRIILNICDMAGFEILGPLILIDKKTKKVWR